MTRDIVAVGASFGGIEALKELVAALPADLPAAVFVVVHLGRDSPEMLPAILDRAGPLVARPVEDGEIIEPGRIYVTPPDRHLLVGGGRVLVRRGPRENRVRPAIDPLFRSAAANFGARVIGVVLTGLLNDGTAGLHAIKRCGGLAVVQDPDDAVAPEMPRNALWKVAVDHCVLLVQMADLLARLVAEPAGPTPAEQALWSALRGHEERAALLRRMAQSAIEGNRLSYAAILRSRAAEAEEDAAK